MVALPLLHVVLALLLSSLQVVLAYPVGSPPSLLLDNEQHGRRDDLAASTYTPTIDSDPNYTLRSAAVVVPLQSSLVVLHSVGTQPIPVARPALPFTFTISSETYSLPLSSLTFTTSDLPSWLGFSQETFTFKGNPSDSDVGKILITINAKNNNGGATVVDSFRLVVKAGTGVVAGDGVVGQLKDGNQALTSVFVLPVNAGVGGLRVPNYWSFSIGFLSSTFKSTSSTPVHYSSFLASGASLPSWLAFDPSSIDFNGNAPGPPSDPSSSTNNTSFDILLCGSDVAGYADYCEHFTLVVAAHSLSFQGLGGQTSVLQRLNLTGEVGTNIEVDWDVVGEGATKGLLLDGRSVNQSDVTSVKVDTRSIGWLGWDESKRSFSGDVPSGALTDASYPTASTKSSNSKLSLPVTIVDKYNDTILLELPISIYPSLFPSMAALPILAAPGKPVSADLSDYLIPTSQSSTLAPALSIVLNPQVASSWLAFTPSTSFLSSSPNVPEDLDYDSVQILLTARDVITNATSHQTILLSIAPGNNATHGHPHRSRDDGLSMRGKTIIGSVFGSLAGIILLCLLLSCCRKHCTTEKHEVDEKRTLEENGWKDRSYDDEAKAYGKEQMYGVQFNTEKSAYGTAYGKSIGVEQLDGVPQLTRIFMDIAKESEGGSGGAQTTPLQKRTSTTTAGKFRSLIKKPLFGGMMGERSREGSPVSAGGLKSNISFPVELSRSASPSSTLNDFDNPRRIAAFNEDGASTLTGTSGGDGLTLDGPGSRASWESEPSYRWEAGSQETGTNAASTPRRQFDGISQLGDLMASSSSHGSFDSHETGNHSASSIDDHEERAEIAQAQRVGMATPTTRSRHDITSSPTDSSSINGQVRVVDFKNERTVQASPGHRSVSHSAVVVNPLPPAAVASPRTKVGVPPLPYDSEAQFRLSAGLTYIPNMNVGEGPDSHSPSTSAIFFTSPPASYSASQIPRLSTPPSAKLSKSRSNLSRTDSLTGGAQSSSQPTVPSSTTNRIARIPSDADIVYASTTEAFSFRPSLDVDAEKPLRGMLKAVVEGSEASPRKGKGLKRLPPWLKFNKGLFDGVPRLGDEGRVDIRVIESFSGLGGQAERVVARFAIEVQTGSQITRRATGRRAGGAKSP